MAKPSSIVSAEQALLRLVQQCLAPDTGLAPMEAGHASPGASAGHGLGPPIRVEANLFEQVFAATPVGMVVFEVATGRIGAANPALSRLLGYSTEELTHLTLLDLIGHEATSPAAATDPGASRSPGMDTLPKALAPSTGGIVIECPCRTKRGHRIWVTLFLAPLPGSWPPGPDGQPTLALATLETITDHTRRGLALAVQDTHYRALVSRLPGAVYRMRAHGISPHFPEATTWVVDFVSDGIVQLLGFPADHFIGSRAVGYDRFIHPEDRGRVQREIADAVAQRVPFRLEYRCLARDGQYRWLLDQGQLGREDGEIYLDGVLIDITDLKVTEARLAYRTSHDTLTGLPNRALFFKSLDRALQTDSCGTYPALAVLMLDIDNFKQVNDCMGHSLGDHLLIEVATRLRSCLPPDDFMARLGGDEFVVQVNGIAGLMEVAQLADRIQQTMQQPLTLGDFNLTISVSIGIALQGRGAIVIYHQAQDMLRDAEIAMYRAKQQGRSQFAIYDTSMHQRAMERLELETALRHACSQDELVVYYQPIVHLETNTVAGLETLVRWQHPTKGLIPPDRFIPVAEEIGFILTLDDWVMAHACQQMAQWQDRWPQMPPLFLSINLSTRHFTRPNLVEHITQVLTATGLSPHRIKLEITESALMENSEVTHQTLKTLNQMGFGISLDDFGVGYSSLSYLHQYPVRTLKIDRSFITNLQRQSESSQIVGAIVAMATSLNLDVVAEGVETVAHVDHLKQLHCQYGQGYWFAKPLPAEDIEPWLRIHCADGPAVNPPNPT